MSRTIFRASDFASRFNSAFAAAPKRQRVKLNPLVTTATSIRLTLPYPPSLNAMYRAVNGRSILSAEGRAYKALTYAKANPLGVFNCPVRVTLGVYRPARRGDLDNTLKATLDALSGVAYRDDSLIAQIDAERFEDRNNPRVEVLVEPYGPKP